MALYNFIRLSGMADYDFAKVDEHIHFVPAEASHDQPDTVDAPDQEDIQAMNEFRVITLQTTYTIGPEDLYLHLCAESCTKHYLMALLPNC
jgi:hypothetical protein